MNYLVITGDHPRHLYYLNSISNYCNLIGAVIERRENFMPIPPKNLEKKDHDNFLKHFRNREKYELKYFGEQKNLPSCQICYFEDNKSSEGKVIDFINKQEVDVIFIFGVLDFVRKIKDKVNQYIILINLNTGLIQRYNGDATLFWPFYFLEPNWAGATFHLIDDTENLNIIHQCVPLLEQGDTIHEVGSKVVVQSSLEIKLIIEHLEKKEKLVVVTLKNTAKLFLESDFIPQHLRVIYNLYKDDIVDHFLSKKISPKEPSLIRLKNEK